MGMKHVTRIFVPALCIALLAGALPAAAQQLCVQASRANLRAGPGTEHRITWEVNRYMPFQQVGTEGDWIKVKDVDGDLHWIYAPLVTDKLDCVTVSAPKANIRKKASTRSEKWFTVEQYTSFKRTGREEKWVKIEYEGQTMWVFAALVWPL